MPEPTWYPEWLRNLLKTRGHNPLRMGGIGPQTTNIVNKLGGGYQPLTPSFMGVGPTRDIYMSTEHKSSSMYDPARVSDPGRYPATDLRQRYDESGQATNTQDTPDWMNRLHGDSTPTIGAWSGEAYPAAAYQARHGTGSTSGGGTTGGGQGNQINYAYLRKLEKWLDDEGYYGNTVRMPIYDNDTGRVVAYDVVRRDGQGNIIRVTKGVAPRGTRFTQKVPSMQIRGARSKGRYNPRSYSARDWQKPKKESKPDTVGASGNWLHSMMSWTG